MADKETKDVVMAEEEEVEEEDIEEDDETSGIVKKLMKDPTVLAHLQEKLHKMLGHPSGYIDSLPENIKNRIKALRKLQHQFTDMEADFYKEVHELEKKYDQQHQSLYEKRRAILSGEQEPTEQEKDYPLKPEDEEDKDGSLCQDLEDKAKVDGEEKPAHGFDENTKGVPEFWLTIFKNVDLLAEMLQEHDEPILVNLMDIKLKFVDDPMGFVLEFHFAENDYFTDKVLTKSYEMKCKPEADDPFKFEGPEIVKCKGCPIDWKKDKNVTQKVIKKRQKHKTKNTIRTVTKTVPRDSFFNFFSPPPIPDDEEAEIEENTQALLTSDFEIGHYIRERVIPRAVLFFTGEGLDDEDYDDDDDDCEEGEDEDDPDYEPPAGGDKQECKQQ